MGCEAPARLSLRGGSGAGSQKRRGPDRPAAAARRGRSVVVSGVKPATTYGAAPVEDDHQLAAVEGLGAREPGGGVVGVVAEPGDVDALRGWGCAHRFLQKVVTVVTAAAETRGKGERTASKRAREAGARRDCEDVAAVTVADEVLHLGVLAIAALDAIEAEVPGRGEKGKV